MHCFSFVPQASGRWRVEPTRARTLSAARDMATAAMMRPLHRWHAATNLRSPAYQRHQCAVQTGRIRRSFLGPDPRLFCFVGSSLPPASGVAAMPDSTLASEKSIVSAVIGASQVSPNMQARPNCAIGTHRRSDQSGERRVFGILLLLGRWHPEVVPRGVRVTRSHGRAARNYR